MGTTQLETAQEPKYWHLKTRLTEALDTEFAVGEILPNERELAARFGVARATLRQALEQLELEGRLQRRRGVGTTVAPPRIGLDVGPAEPELTGDAWHTDGCAQTLPPAAVARLLALAPGGRTHAVRRTRTSQGQPVATELLYVPTGDMEAPQPEQDPDRLEADGTSEALASANRVLEHLRSLEWEGQDRAVELGSARAEDARLLDQLPGAPVLVVTTRYFAAGRTALVGVATYRADTCRLTFGNAEALPLAG